MQLQGRTLTKNGDWNTLTLPFAISNFTGTPLEGATVKELNATTSNLNNGTLTLNFISATSIEAGKPYIIKWTGGTSLESPTFTGVTIENATAEIAAQLEAGDASKLQQAIEAAKEKVQELLQDNPEMAKEYLTKVQNFLKENAERVKAVVGDNAVVQTAVSALTDMPVDNILESLQALGADGQQAAEQAAKLVEEAPDAVKEAANQKIEEGKEAVKEKAKEKLNEEADKALKQLGL